jgi:hypothetical protein
MEEMPDYYCRLCDDQLDNYSDLVCDECFRELEDLDKKLGIIEELKDRGDL